jgi:hypothetical protein
VSGPKRIATECREMEEAHNASSSENEVKGVDVHLGAEGSHSNRHGEEIDKEGNMMKIIERLQKDAQTHRADNLESSGKTRRIQLKVDEEFGENKKEVG